MTLLLEFEDIPLQRLRRRTLAGVLPSAIGQEMALTLAVRSHETVVALGDEASGVDSLGALALGLEDAPTGSVRVFGIDLATIPRRERLAFRRRIGYLPAGDGLLHNLSLRDNIRLPLGFASDQPPEAIEGRTDIILAQLHLPRVAELRPAQANEEERRRAALGRAIALDPELVVLEQPFDGLTEQVAAELLEVARGGELPQGGRRAILISAQDIPVLLRPRVERMVRVINGQAISLSNRQ